MVLKIVVVCVVVVLGVGDVTPSLVNPVQGSNPQPREWPCPDDAAISPCTCSITEDYDMKLDCSLVTSNEELARVFSSVFPYTQFLELRIVQDPSDPNYDINAIETGLFTGFSFERIIIQGTKLKVIEDHTFTDSQDLLNYLNLANNDLYSFPFEVITLYPKLATLILDDNAFTQLPSILSSSIEVLSVSGNANLQLTNFDDLTSLQEIYIGRINLDVLPPNLFMQLHYLNTIDVQGNELTDLNEYTIATPSQTLKTVIADHNLISTIHHDTFHGLVFNAEVSMRSNLVIDLFEESWKHVFDQLVPDGILDLEDNPLRCGCEMAWIMFSPEREDLQIITDTTLCSSGAQVSFLDVQFFCKFCDHIVPDVCP
nr:oplophorus-luciferin 2-monooxygenase non-catalytic subunit-like [Procambarus clarkii]